MKSIDDIDPLEQPAGIYEVPGVDVRVVFWLGVGTAPGTFAFRTRANIDLPRLTYKVREKMIHGIRNGKDARMVGYYLRLWAST